MGPGIAWVYETLRPAGLTQLFHGLDIISAVTAAGVFFMQGSPAELLTLHTLPRGEKTWQLKQSTNSPKSATYPQSFVELRNEEALLAHRQDLASQLWI